MSVWALIVGALATAPSVQEPRSGTSLFFRCQVQPRGETITHELDVVYFSDPPGRTHKFNTRDPDGFLPRSARPMLADAWPTALLVTYLDANKRLATMKLEPIESSPDRASVKIDLMIEGPPPQRRYAGACSYSVGAVAEQEFLELLK